MKTRRSIKTTGPRTGEAIRIKRNDAPHKAANRRSIPPSRTFIIVLSQERMQTISSSGLDKADEYLACSLGIGHRAMCCSDRAPTSCEQEDECKRGRNENSDAVFQRRLGEVHAILLHSGYFPHQFTGCLD